MHYDGTMYDGWFIAGIFTDNDVLQRLKSFEVKKEPKVYNAANCEEAMHLIDDKKFVDAWFASTGWQKHKLIGIDTLGAINKEKPYIFKYLETGGNFYSQLIRECKQPKEIRKVTVEEIYQKMIQYLQRHKIHSHAQVEHDSYQALIKHDPKLLADIFDEEVIVV